MYIPVVSDVGSRCVIVQNRILRFHVVCLKLNRFLRAFQSYWPFLTIDALCNFFSFFLEYSMWQFTIPNMWMQLIANSVEHTLHRECIILLGWLVGSVQLSSRESTHLCASISFVCCDVVLLFTALTNWETGVNPRAAVDEVAFKYSCSGPTYIHIGIWTEDR